jgi:hypothetical protein
MLARFHRKTGVCPGSILRYRDNKMYSSLATGIYLSPSWTFFTSAQSRQLDYQTLKIDIQARHLRGWRGMMQTH